MPKSIFLIRLRAPLLLLAALAALAGEVNAQGPTLGDPSLLGTRTGASSSAIPGAMPSVSPVPSTDLKITDTKTPIKPELPALITTQFQRFAQEATGKLLPLYGYKLFEGGRYPAVTDVPAPSNYVLGVADEIDLKIWGVIDLSLRLQVDRNGQITIPKVGNVTVSGIRADQLEKHLKAQVARVFSNFELSATLGRLRSVQIFVVGEARQPGAYSVSSLSTLVSALFETGGPAATGSMRNIRLVRDGKTVTTLDLYAFLHAGQVSADARLMPGDVIVIPPVGPRVGLQGALDNQAIYELSGPEEPLGRLLDYSGGRQVLTATPKALVERVNPGQSQASRSVEERVLDGRGLQSMVRDGDIVTLLGISPEFANAVTLRGNVAQALRHSHRPGMRVSDLIPEASALITRDFFGVRNSLVQFETPTNSALADPRQRFSGGQLLTEIKNQLSEVNWEYAVIERLNPLRVELDLIPFNLGLAVKNRDPSHNLELLAGDVVTVFGVKDLPVPISQRKLYVRLGGEVKAPGVYQVQSGETLPQLITRAGGLTREAYPYATQLSRESTKAVQQENLDRTLRRMESAINSDQSMLAQNMGDPARANPAQLQLQQQAAKASLEKLRSLKPSGRVALEMDPRKPVLPPIALEDGDTITVPNRPGFVSVYGSVFTESSLVHRTGLMVGDYLEKAGPTPEADLQSIMLIRADGTVVASKAQRSLFGFGHAGFMSLNMEPGDAIFVPEKLDRRTSYNQFIQGAKDWTQLLYQFGLGVAAIKTLRN
jgi:protein involved in polysaccharide export with SLBB domain